MQKLSDPSLESLRYPIGRFDPRAKVGPDAYAGLIDTIAACPARMREAVAGLDDGQLDTRYRDGGWTVRQVVHHVPDSHVNSYVRFRLAMTEDTPRIMTYAEARWAELPDARQMPVGVSLDLLDALHARWVTLLRSMDVADFDRTLDHPEMGMLPLESMLRLYAWHSLHHVAHITQLRERMGW